MFQPDAAFTWNKKPYYLEYQSHRTDLGPNDWSRKWELRQEMYRRKLWKDHFKIEPTIIVLSRQQPEKVKTGAEGLPIRVLKDISHMKGWYEL